MSARKAAAAVLFQRRVLTVITGLLAISFLTWIIAISTDYWNIVDGGEGIYIPKTGNYFLQSHNGVFRICRTTFRNKTTKTHPNLITDRCSYTNFFPEINQQHQQFFHYQRTVAAFSIIAVFIKIMGILFSLYTFRHTRYMYKRLAACSHVLAVGCDLVVLEVNSTATYFADAKLPFRHPPDSNWHFGFSCMLAWSSFAIDVIAAIGFALCSRKKKKEKAPNYEFALDEEPTILGR